MTRRVNVEQPANHLLVLGPVLFRFLRVFDVRGNEPSRIQNVTKSAELVSFHTSTRPWPGCARGRSGFAISQGTGARQNRRGDQPLLPPRLPFPAAHRSRPALTHRKSPADPHHCWALLSRALQNRKPPAAGCGASRRTDAAARADLREIVPMDLSTCSKHNRTTRCLQGANGCRTYGSDGAIRRREQRGKVLRLRCQV